MNKVTVGILGGMGPRATLEFQSKLLAQFSGPDQSLPRIICSNNGSIPDRSDFLVNNGPDPLDVLIEEARMLTRSKVDIVCMPCNTAHSPKILSRLMAQVPLPIIDMPAACISEAEQKNFSTVLILGTTGSNRCKVFDTRTTKTNCIYPKTDDQVFIDTLIKTFKSGLQPSGVNINRLQNIVKQTSAEAVILGCTELSFLPQNIFEIPMIDSMETLAQVCATLCVEYNKTKEKI